MSMSARVTPSGTPSDNAMVITAEEEGDQEIVPVEENPEPPPPPPIRNVGDEVELAPGLFDEGEKNGLKEGEMCTVIFANAKYGNYKLKRNSDERELYWFKSDELWGEDERQAKINQASAEAAALQAQIDSAVVEKQEEQAAQIRPPTGSANNKSNTSQEESKEEEEGGEEGGEGGGGAVANALAELHVEAEVDKQPASTITKTTTMLVEELFNHTQSEAARDEVVMLMEALRYRIKLPFFGAHHIRTFAGLHGEAMCLEYLQRPLWQEDYMLAALVLRTLEPCLQYSDQVCARFAASAGREVLMKVLERNSHDEEVVKLVPKCLQGAQIKSAFVAKRELVRMRRSLQFCSKCRPRYYQHGLFGTYHPYLCADPHGDGDDDIPDHGHPNSVFERPGNDADGPTDLERSLVPNGDVEFWFETSTVNRYRNKERHGLSRTAPQVAAKAAADAVLLAIQTGQEPEPSNEPGATAGNPLGFAALALAAREEDAALSEAMQADKRRATDTAMLRQLVNLLLRFIKDSDVTVCALEVLLHYATSGDEKALIDAQVADAVAAALKSHPNGASPGGRRVQWRGCVAIARLVTRSDVLKAEVGRSEAPLEVLHAITRCPLDRPLQQQALWAIHYCCLHDSTRRRLLTGGGGLPSSSSEQQQQHQQQQRGKVEKKVANPLVRVLAVLLVVRPHEIATAKAEQTQAEALQELAGVASTANVRQRDVVNTAASGASQKSDKPGAEKHKKKRTTEELLRDSISRDLVLPIEMHSYTSIEALKEFLKPPKFQADSFKAPEKMLKAKPKFGTAQ